MRNSGGLAVVSCLVLALAACGDEGAAPAASASASAPAKTAAPPAASTVKPTASAAAELPPRTDCPADSAGPGTLEKPCLGKGKARLMEAKWTGKTDDKGPFFSVTNTGKQVILYGNISVFFYDKDGKAIEITEGGINKKTFKTCAGKIFGGVMKAGEKATIQFSCMKKEDVPEGAVTIEGELATVGFADASGEKVDYYWSNPDLIPAARPKGGVK
jgi:hypothetical protein